MERFYFAYGSNMWHQQMAGRCPESVKLGIGELRNYRWIISKRGYASIVGSKGNVVQGVLYRITCSDEDKLDKKEGVHSGCYFKADLAVRFGGSEITALTYIDHVSEEGIAKPEYIQRINRALADAQLSEAYVNSNIRTFIPASGNGPIGESQ